MLTPEILLQAYASGIFPMAENRDDPDVFWVDPKMRGIISLEQFHIPRRLARQLKKNPYDVRCDTDFPAIIKGCAASREKEDGTWINDLIIDLYTELFKMGHVHSVECWKDGKLVGGLYGIALAGAFFGESMFSLEADASKIALVHLVARLRVGGFSLLDTQFVTEHLSRFGAQEIPRAEYHVRLAEALKKPGRFQGVLEDSSGVIDSLVRQSITQTS